jgi:hypothetical protein
MTIASLPLVALVPAAPEWLAGGPGPAILLRFALLALVVLMALLAGASLPRTGAAGQERLAWVGYLVPALLGDPRRRLAIPAIALSNGWLTTAAFRVLVV